MKTKITELFGIEHPIIQGGMHYVGFAELALPYPTPAALASLPGSRKRPLKTSREISSLQRTDKPFGVNLTFLPTLRTIPATSKRSSPAA